MIYKLHNGIKIPSFLKGYNYYVSYNLVLLLITTAVVIIWTTIQTVLNREK